MIIPALIYVSGLRIQKSEPPILISQLLYNSRKGPERVIISGKGKLIEWRKKNHAQFEFDHCFMTVYSSSSIIMARLSAIG